MQKVYTTLHESGASQPFFTGVRRAYAENRRRQQNSNTVVRSHKKAVANLQQLWAYAERTPETAFRTIACSAKHCNRICTESVERSSGNHGVRWAYASKRATARQTSDAIAKPDKPQIVAYAWRTPQNVRPRVKQMMRSRSPTKPQIVAYAWRTPQQVRPRVKQMMRSRSPTNRKL